MRRLRLLLGLVGAVAVSAAVAPPALGATFANTSAMTVPGGIDEYGPADLYPSDIEVDGLTGPVDDVNVTLNRVGHEHVGDLAVLLVSPSGRSVKLMRSNCFGSTGEDYVWTFDQEAADGMPQTGECGELTYRPNPENAFDPWTQPAPNGPHGTSLDDFDGENPNGTWSLYVYDIYIEDVGDIELGWTLTVGTAATDTAVPASGTAGAASRFPATQTVGPTTERVTDVDVGIGGVWHQRPDDLELLLVGPEGQATVLMSDACGSYEAEGVDWSWDDEATAPMSTGDASNNCPSGSYRPVNHDASETWAPPAPTGPHPSDLSVFDGTNPSGAWQLYAADDATSAVGFFGSRFQLDIETEPLPPPPPPAAFGSDTSVSLALTRKRVSPKRPVKVAVANGNAFAVTGLLRGVPFEVAPGSEATVAIPLKKREARKLRRKAKARLELNATLRDPAGNERLVQTSAKVKRKGRRR